MTFKRSRILGLLVRSTSFYNFENNLPYEQILQKFWRHIYIELYPIYRPDLCAIAFSLLIDEVGEYRLTELGLPATEQEVLEIIATKSTNQLSANEKTNFLAKIKKNRGNI